MVGLPSSAVAEHYQKDKVGLPSSAVVGLPSSAVVKHLLWLWQGYCPIDLQKITTFSVVTLQ